MFGNDDFVKKIVRIFAEEFVSVLRTKGYFEHWNDFLSVEEAASVLGITRDRMFEMIEDGSSPRCYRHSFQGYRFDPEDIQRWMERRILTAILNEKVNSSEIREEDVAKMLNIKPYYFTELRKKGEGPEHTRSATGGAIVYTYGAIQTWINTRIGVTLKEARQKHKDHYYEQGKTSGEVR